MTNSRHGATQICADCAAEYPTAGEQDVDCPRCGAKPSAETEPGEPQSLQSVWGAPFRKLP
jgi:hypothetical protein